MTKSDQEVAVASWINYLNDQRIQIILTKLQNQDINYEQAIDILSGTLDTINEEIIKNANNGFGNLSFDNFN